MTKIKFCGLTRAEDITAANALKPEYIGFVFAPKSKRYVSPQQAALLRARLDPAIKAVGVFVNEPPEAVARLLNEKLIDIAQLHGQEDAAYLARLRSLTAKPLWQAFRAESAAGLAAAARSTADMVLLDPAQAAQAQCSTGSCCRAFRGLTFWPAGWMQTTWQTPQPGCTPMRWM